MLPPVLHSRRRDLFDLLPLLTIDLVAPPRKSVSKVIASISRVLLSKALDRAEITENMTMRLDQLRGNCQDGWISRHARSSVHSWLVLEDPRYPSRQAQAYGLALIRIVDEV